MPGSKAKYFNRNHEAKALKDRIDFAEVEKSKIRSSVASLSTLKIPKSLCPNGSRAGSSVYSCDTREMDITASPGQARASRASSNLLPDLSPGQAISLDELIFKALEWNPLVEPGSSSPEFAAPDTVTECHPRDRTGSPPTSSSINEQSTPLTAEAETSCTNSPSSKVLVPHISIARSSDDVFGGAGLSQRAEEGENTLEMADDGRGLRLRTMISKLSQEDLMRYSGRTAPGGVEWV